MPKKKYNCNECGFIFPDELSELIDKRTQVYCEKCGKPFSIKGVVFKPATIQPPPPPRPTREKKPVVQKPPSQGHPHYEFAQKDREKFHHAIQKLNKYSSIPILIVSIVLLVFASYTLITFILNVFNIPGQYINYNLFLMINNFALGICGLAISVYDMKFISLKIKEKKYNEIVVDSFCWGIVGCVIYGAGVILIFKGIVILIYNILENKNFGYHLKNSLNNFSATLGVIILILAASSTFINLRSLDPFGFVARIVFFSITTIALYIDYRYKNEIREKRKFMVNDAVLFFILGILGVTFGSAGIFILFKGILFFFLIYVKPPEEEIVVLKPVADMAIDMAREIKKEDGVEIIKETTPPVIEEPQEIELSKKQVKELKEHAKKTEKLKKELEKKPTVEKEIELKLHESLLPVKDEKDKELVKHYFTRIFSVLSKELKNQINDLKISKKEKKELLKELAFLTREEQLKYIDAIVELYKEIPKKLIDRIKKLPNVQLKHYDKIVDQLKYLDVEEQIRYVQFLEENA